MKLTPKAFVVIFSMLVAVSAAGCRKEQPPASKPASDRVSRADFKPARIRPVNASDRPESQQTAESEAPKVVALVNEFYAAAFVDPAKWSGGTHPALSELFTAEAKPHIGANLGALALADLAPRLKELNPKKQDLPLISFYIEDNLSVPFGVVTTSFEARATPATGKTPVAIVHNASFWVVKEGDAYKIYAYSSELKADSQTKSSAFGVPPGGSLR